MNEAKTTFFGRNSQNSGGSADPTVAVPAPNKSNSFGPNSPTSAGGGNQIDVALPSAPIPSADNPYGELPIPPSTIPPTTTTTMTTTTTKGFERYSHLYLNYSNVAPPCGPDVLFVLDSTGSVREIYEDQRRYIQDVAAQMDIGPNGQHVGMDICLREFDY